MSKGSNQRPAFVPEQDIQDNWARIFRKPENPQPAPEPAGKPEEQQQ